MKDIGILKLLCQTTGVTGHEKNIAVIIRNIFEKFCSEVVTDPFSNVIGVMKAKVRESSFAANGDKPVRILFTAHMDEIGMMVSRIETGGFLKISKISGVDPKVLVAKKLLIHSAEGPLKGIVASVPPHLSAPEDRKKALMFEDLYVDTGLPEEVVREKVQIGDIVSFAPSFETQGMHMVSGKALDNRAGIFTLVKIMQLLKEKSFCYDIIFLAAVSEEFDSFGAAAGTHRLEPDLAVVVDVTHGKVGMLDVPPEDKQFFSLGKGPVICRSPILNRKLTDGLIAISREKGWKPGVEVDNRDTGTDALAVAITGRGCATALVSIPIRYMHTQVEMLQLEDIEATAEVLAELALQNSIQVREYLCY